MNREAVELDAEIRGLLATRGVDADDDRALEAIVTEVLERHEREYLEGHEIGRAHV